MDSVPCGALEMRKQQRGSVHCECVDLLFTQIPEGDFLCMPFVVVNSIILCSSSSFVHNLEWQPMDKLFYLCFSLGPPFYKTWSYTIILYFMMWGFQRMQNNQNFTSIAKQFVDPTCEIFQSVSLPSHPVSDTSLSQPGSIAINVNATPYLPYNFCAVWLFAWNIWLSSPILSSVMWFLVYVHMYMRDVFFCGFEPLAYLFRNYCLILVCQ